MQIVVDGLLTTYLSVNPNKRYILLILHGWGQSSSFWQGVCNSLPSEVSGMALDLPAFGSTQPLSGSPGVKDYSIFVLKFIEKLKLKNVILLGHSFGGQVAVDFALNQPELIKHLILLSPACIRNPHPTLKSRLLSSFKPLLKLLPNEFNRWLFEKIASKNYLTSNPVQRDVMKRILREDYSEKITKLTISTSIIWGSEDREISNEGKFLSENIKNSRLYVLYGADHSPHITAPQKLLPVLNEILSCHSRIGGNPSD